MSIFGKIMSAIFGTKADAAPAGGGAAAGWIVRRQRLLRPSMSRRSWMRR